MSAIASRVLVNHEGAQRWEPTVADSLSSLASHSGQDPLPAQLRSDHVRERIARTASLAVLMVVLEDAEGSTSDKVVQ